MSQKKKVKWTIYSCFYSIASQVVT